MKAKLAKNTGNGPAVSEESESTKRNLFQLCFRLDDIAGTVRGADRFCNLFITLDANHIPYAVKTLQDFLNITAMEIDQLQSAFGDILNGKMDEGANEYLQVLRKANGEADAS